MVADKRMGRRPCEPMKPYHLQIQLTRESSRLNAQWFGTSALDAAGSAQCMIRLDADMALVPDQLLIDQLLIDQLLIDLQPLLAEIANDTISSQEDFQAADEFLLLRALLADDEFEKLCETLYHFLWSEAQRGAESAVVQKGD